MAHEDLRAPFTIKCTMGCFGGPHTEQPGCRFGPDPQPEPAADCHICGEPKDQPGKLICSAPHDRGKPARWGRPEPAAEPAARWEALEDSDVNYPCNWYMTRGDNTMHACLMFEHEARALADHLNTSGPDGGPWVPQPARPTWQQAAWDAWCEDSDNGVAPSAMTEALAEHGWAVVDVQALAEAIEWLRRQRQCRWPVPKGGQPLATPAVAILDALGVER